MKKKLVSILDTVFGGGICICLFAGGLTFFGFVAALVIGGETATSICLFLQKKVFYWIIAAGSLLTLLGLVRIYLTGDHSLRLEKKKKEK